MPVSEREEGRLAVEALYKRYALDLYRRVILPRCLDRDLADEALAETFRTVMISHHEYVARPDGHFPWLARIAISKTMDVHRARARTSKALASFARLVHPLMPEAPSADAETRRREERALHAALHATLAELRPRYRRAIELRFFEERSRAECASLLDVSTPTFDVLLLRALRAFREAFEARVPSEDRS